MGSDFDMDEIFQLFLEESFEGLDVMETGLLNLEIGAADSDTINNIFRAAHSIKGGAGTLGHMEISEFTHGVETLLDEIRGGRRTTTRDNVELLLRSVDHLRSMLTETRSGQTPDKARSRALQDEIEAMLAADSGSPGSSSGDEGSNDEAGADSDSVDPSGHRYHIDFRPCPELFERGNDPVLLLRELGKLGELKVVPRTDALPSLVEMQPEHCYLSFALTLETSADHDAVKEIFEWVLDDCELSIYDEKAELVPLVGAPLTATDEVPPVEPPAAPSAGETDVNRGTSPASAPEGAGVARKKQPASRDSASIRVSTEKVDTLLNLVGELVITQSMLRRFGNEDANASINELRDGLLQLERHTRELQESVMQIRMLPISFCFSRFPRLVHDLSMKLGKKVDLELEGQQTELDKTVLENISDPLVHLVRNSLDHGIESTERRTAAGKPETGVIRLSASQEGGNIVIQVADDGAGLNRERILEKARERGLIGPDETLPNERIDNLIFAPGFSTAESVSDVSGRGVGMDVVRRNIKDLGGRVEVHSEPGKGSVFTIRLPLTLAILDGQLVRVGRETYIISLLSIVETAQVTPDQINTLPGRGRVYRMRDQYIPVISLAECFCIDSARESRAGGLLVIVEADDHQYGLFVDELLDQQQVVIKSLEENYRQVDGLAGATILGDGMVALILDVPGLLTYVKGHAARGSEAA